MVLFLSEFLEKRFHPIVKMINETRCIVLIEGINVIIINQTSCSGDPFIGQVTPSGSLATLA